MHTCAKVLNAIVHVLRINHSQAVGKWSKIKPIVNHVLVRNNVKTYAHDFNTKDHQMIRLNK